MLLSLFTVALAATTALAHRHKKIDAAALEKRCANSPDARSCWGDFDITSNYYDTWPETGVVREYWFNIENGTGAPDGIKRNVMTVNGSVPGPTIIADWGDTIVVHVTNSLTTNGTGIHWHGVRQINTTQMDGVPSITQCPIAPGETYTYTWQAVQYGSSWYHSHFYVQAWNGVFGGIIINGPASQDYDEDLGVLLLNDWTHDTADNTLLRAEAQGVPQQENGLMNGTNTYTDPTTGVTTGSRFTTTFTKGTRYRLRLVNAAAEAHFRFTIDNHTFDVIQTDFVPIKHYSTNMVSIGMGQRYDIIVTANQTEDAYWMRAIMQKSCTTNDNLNGTLGIIRYSTVAGQTTDPVSTIWSDPYYTDNCHDEDMSKLVPMVSIDAGSSPSTTTNFNVNLVTGTFHWELGPSSFNSSWAYPTVRQLYDGNENFTAAQNVQLYPNANEWVYWVIKDATGFGVNHPLHMHGHDFWVLAQGYTTYDASTVTLQYTDTPRRDVVMLPANGYVIIGFVTDNPGAWIMHCHIAWHTSEGLAVQFVERQSEFIPKLDMNLLNSTCAAWDTYVNKDHVIQDDSGL